jgi:hypothetical protein
LFPCFLLFFFKGGGRKEGVYFRYFIHKKNNFPIYLPVPTSKIIICATAKKKPQHYIWVILSMTEDDPIYDTRYKIIIIIIFNTKAKISKMTF